jgi:hypothetical protein
LIFKTILIVHGSVAVADPHHFGNRDPDPIQSEKQDPDPHQNEMVEALEGHLGALEDPNPGEMWVVGSGFGSA